MGYATDCSVAETSCSIGRQTTHDRRRPVPAANCSAALAGCIRASLTRWLCFDVGVGKWRLKTARFKPSCSSPKGLRLVLLHSRHCAAQGPTRRTARQKPLFCCRLLLAGSVNAKQIQEADFRLEGPARQGQLDADLEKDLCPVAANGGRQLLGRFAFEHPSGQAAVWVWLPVFSSRSGSQPWRPGPAGPTPATDTA